ncbi:hypothetical protein Scep_017601 [Stephania cephalantha]|uniref:Uncharacterized protein n=1 Tax=Stephania cephalantha TaxID=152367 RepID=A0AAP0IR69_9MAGN
MSHSFRRSLSDGSLLPFDPKIEKTCHRNSKESRQRNHSSRVQLNDEQPPLLADHIGNPHAPYAPVAPHEGREEPLVIPPRQFVAPGVPHAPVEQQRHVVPQSTTTQDDKSKVRCENRSTTTEYNKSKVRCGADQRPPKTARNKFDVAESEQRNCRTADIRVDGGQIAKATYADSEVDVVVATSIEST